MKKQTRKILLGAATVAAIAGIQNRAGAATEKLDIEARIFTSAALLITDTAALNFGSLTEAGAGGTLTVHTDGSKTAGAGITPIGGPLQAGGFKIKGVNGKNATFTMPTIATIKNGLNTMKVDNFKIGTASKAPGTFVFPLTGNFQSGISVGGTLNVGAGQLSGTYTGTVGITTNYQ